MTTRDDGGPAFPHMMAEGHRDYAGGLTKREYAAITMAQGLLAADAGGDWKPEAIASYAVAAADALLTALARKERDHG